VKRAAEDAAGYPNMTWGVPLSDAEAAEIQSRIQVMESLLPAIHEAQKDPSWAGWQLDHAAGGVPVMYVAADAASRADALAKLAPPSTRVVVVEVERSLDDLEALRDRLKASKPQLLAAGTRITGLTIDVVNNQVIVDVVPFTPDAVLSVGKAAGDEEQAIVVRENEPTRADACPESECLNPVKGGAGMQEDGNDVYPNNTPCTAGYLARRTDTSPDKLVIVTAGHCNFVRQGWGAEPWQHGGSGDPGPNIDIGSIAMKDGGIVSTWVDGANADVGLVNTGMLSSSDVAVKNSMLVRLDPSVRVLPVERVFLHADTFVGMPVCRMGYRTKLKCGTVINTDATKDDSWGSYSVEIDHVVVYSRDAIGGDSGGPVFYTVEYPLSYAVLVGTHVHSYNHNNDNIYYPDKKGWYSPYDRGKNQLSNMLGVEITPCLTTTCGF
jgi:hypothetical protein